MKIQKMCSAMIGALLIVTSGAAIQVCAEETAAQIQITEIHQALAASPDINGISHNEDGTISYLCDGVKQTGVITVTPDFIMADFNGDGIANAMDATTILKASAAAATGKQSADEIIAAESEFVETSYEALQIGDTNSDGEINALDATQVLAYSAKNGAGETSKPLGYAVYFADENGTLKKGWIVTDNGTYYGNDSYNLSSGWITIDGKRYCFSDDYSLVQNEIQKIGDKTYYLDTDGTVLTNTWLDVDGSMRYFGDSGEMLTGIQIINNTLYAFTMEGATASGWFNQNETRYYAKDNGMLSIGLQTIADKNYYFADNGVLVTGWVKLDDGTRYASEDGAFVTGDQTIDGVSYHFGDDGRLQVSGWVEESGKKRYLLEDGSYLKGVQKIGSNFYAFDNDGSMLTGWILSGGKYRYAGTDGVICMGLFRFNEKYVYFDNIDGAMVTGWQTINGNQYYFDENGIMVTGTYSVDGISYEFGADGKLQERKIKICIDAGHYGKVNHSPVNDAYYESDFTWNYHFYLADALRAHGIEVITTRAYKDVDMELEARGRCSEGCDLFLSLHSNATGNGKNTNTTADGPLACCNVDGSTDVLGLQLAQTVANVMETNNPGTIWKRVYPDRPGVDYYGVLRGAKSVGTPGILLEHSYHTNYRATVWLMNDANLIRMADAEAQTIATYYGLS